MLLPRSCAVCGSTLGRAEEHICLECLAGMPLTYFWQLPHNPMADRLNARVQQAMEHSPAPYEAYSYACALYYYKENYRGLSRAVKYDARLSLGRFLGRHLGSVLLRGTFADVDAVLPVPLHWTRRLLRGYNQAQIIALAVAEVMGTVCRTDILRRRRRTQSQARLKVSEKAANVRGAFEVSDKALQSFAASCGRAPRHILLVDDVFTTGSTLTECHRALRAALTRLYGAQEAAGVKISVATLAFVGD